MALIEFKNLPDTTTPLNAENINHNFNALYTEITNAKTVNLKNAWRAAFKPKGSELLVIIPIFNPNDTEPTINITSAKIFDGAWHSAGAVNIISYNTNQIILALDNTLSLTDGYTYLVQLLGTISCD